MSIDGEFEQLYGAVQSEMSPEIRKINIKQIFDNLVSNYNGKCKKPNSSGGKLNLSYALEILARNDSLSFDSSLDANRTNDIHNKIIDTFKLKMTSSESSITWEEFENYILSISTTIVDDNVFILSMNKIWNINYNDENCDSIASGVDLSTFIVDDDDSTVFSNLSIEVCPPVDVVEVKSIDTSYNADNYISNDDENMMTNDGNDEFSVRSSNNIRGSKHNINNDPNYIRNRSSYTDRNNKQHGSHTPFKQSPNKVHNRITDLLHRGSPSPLPKTTSVAPYHYPTNEDNTFHSPEKNKKSINPTNKLLKDLQKQEVLINNSIPRAFDDSSCVDSNENNNIRNGHDRYHNNDKSVNEDAVDVYSSSKNGVNYAIPKQNENKPTVSFVSDCSNYDINTINKSNNDSSIRSMKNEDNNNNGNNKYDGSKQAILYGAEVSLQKPSSNKKENKSLSSTSNFNSYQNSNDKTSDSTYELSKSDINDDANFRKNNSTNDNDGKATRRFPYYFEPKVTVVNLKEDISRFVHNISSNKRTKEEVMSQNASQRVNESNISKFDRALNQSINANNEDDKNNNNNNNNSNSLLADNNTPQRIEKIQSPPSNHILHPTPPMSSSRPSFSPNFHNKRVESVPRDSLGRIITKKNSPTQILNDLIRTSDGRDSYALSKSNGAAIENHSALLGTNTDKIALTYPHNVTDTDKNNNTSTNDNNFAITSVNTGYGRHKVEQSFVNTKIEMLIEPKYAKESIYNSNLPPTYIFNPHVDRHEFTDTLRNKDKIRYSEEDRNRDDSMYFERRQNNAHYEYTYNSSPRSNSDDLQFEMMQTNNYDYANPLYNSYQNNSNINNKNNSKNSNNHPVIDDNFKMPGARLGSTSMRRWKCDEILEQGSEEVVFDDALVLPMAAGGGVGKFLHPHDIAMLNRKYARGSLIT